MKLNDEQIQALFDFTKKKLVHFYDLQIELVDHLAASIEEEMELDKKLKFEDALERVYRKFGIFGFSQIVQQKQKQLERLHFKRWMKEVFSLFRWPQALGSLTLLGLLYTLDKTVDADYLRIGFGVIAIAFMVFNIINLRKYRKPKKQLMIMQYYTPGIASIWCYFYLQYLINFYSHHTFFFILINFVGIIFIMASYQLNIKLKAEAMRLYPEVFE